VSCTRNGTSNIGAENARAFGIDYRIKKSRYRNHARDAEHNGVDRMEIKSQRGTGRTYRLVEKAVDYAMDGQRVAFVCDPHLFEYVTAMIHRIADDKKVRVEYRQPAREFTFPSCGWLRLFRPVQPGRRDEQTIGMQLDQVVYDHAL
jgi:hypothetical protein